LQVLWLSRAKSTAQRTGQVVKVFDLVIARTGLRDHEAAPLGREPVTITTRRAPIMVASATEGPAAMRPGPHRNSM